MCLRERCKPDFEGSFRYGLDVDNLLYRYVSGPMDGHRDASAAHSSRSTTIDSSLYPSEQSPISHEDRFDVRHGYAICVGNAHSEKFILGSLVSLHVDFKGPQECEYEQCKSTHSHMDSL